MKIVSSQTNIRNAIFDQRSTRPPEVGVSRWHRQTNGHGDSMTNSAQRGRVVENYKEIVKIFFCFSLKFQPLGRQGVSNQLCSVLHIFGSRDNNNVETFRPPGALSIQLINSSFSSGSSKHHKSQTVRAKELQF